MEMLKDAITPEKLAQLKDQEARELEALKRTEEAEMEAIGGNNRHARRKAAALENRHDR